MPSIRRIGQYLLIPGHTGDEHHFAAGLIFLCANGVTFKLNLKPGRDELWAKFTDEAATPMGAFYAYVTKVE